MLNIKLRRESFATEVTEPELVNNQLQTTIDSDIVREYAHASNNQFRVSALLENIPKSKSCLNKSLPCDIPQANSLVDLKIDCCNIHPPVPSQPPVESNLHVLNTDIPTSLPPVLFRPRSMPLFTQHPVELTTCASHSNSNHVNFSSSGESPKRAASLHQYPLQDGTKLITSHQI